MDVSLRLLGPYAEAYKNGFKSDKTDSTPIIPRKRHFESLHMKKNVKFAEDAESKRASWTNEKENKRKAVRALKFMKEREARHPNKKPSNTVHEKTTKPTTDRNVEEGPANDPNNNEENNAIPNARSKAAKSTDSAPDKNARREQLKKWRRERDAIDAKSKKAENQKTKSVNNSENSAASTKNNMKTKVGGSKNPNNVKKTTQADSKISRPDSSKQQGAASVQVEVKDLKKRVTRATSKALDQEKTSSKTKSKKVVSSHKDEDISAMPAQQGSSQPSKKSQASTKSNRLVDKEERSEKRDTTKGTKLSTKVPAVSDKKQPMPIKPEDSIENPVPSTLAEKSGISEPQGSSKGNLPSVEWKEMKPRAIDEIFIKFNKKFAKACEILNAYSTKWTEIQGVENDAIRDEVQGEIRSALGNVTLLLKSKLPQFATLLYKYLCQEDFGPRSILPCDLEGWWEVASIQVEATLNKFKDLDKLRKNKWRKLAAATPSPPRGGSSKTPLLRQLSRNFSKGDGCEMSIRILKVRDSMGTMSKMGAVAISAENDQGGNEET
ncbi:Disks large-associated protein 2 [Orchesella cincta]|uniref:Disks large-associated protein 2 n=1 Tax=Orchesella cincta TaxID=48709 RepID=A0A1D2N0I0_ORCCI|nr:Disks large-associated protein 2 [Orchesella cincta]